MLDEGAKVSLQGETREVQQTSPAQRGFVTVPLTRRAPA